MDVFPNNKIGSYHVKFPQTFDLNGEWEVGLYSISYPNTWYTLQKQQNHVYYTKNAGKSYAESRGMLKQGEGVLEEREKKREASRTKRRAKKRKALHLQPDVNRPSEREHLLETYSVKYEFRAQ